jgi:hypothetical protein
LPLSLVRLGAGVPAISVTGLANALIRQEKQFAGLVAQAIRFHLSY